MSELILPWSREKLREDYVQWHGLQVGSKDIDPVYPVLAAIADSQGLDQEQRAWLVICHVVWYHPGSTLAGFQLLPRLEDIPDDAVGMWELGLLDLPTGTERRGHRPKPPLISHLLGLRSSLEGGAWQWVLRAASGDSPTERWDNLIAALLGLQGNGRWAAYKTAEMMQKVCGLDVQAPDAGHKFSSGPRKGLQVLEENIPTGNSDSDIFELDLITDLWAERLGEPDVAQVETSLCDFNSLVGGRYYLGHDIDSMQESWHNPKVSEFVEPWAWEAREKVFEPEFLGEKNGRVGVQKDKKSIYKKEGSL